METVTRVCESTMTSFRFSQGGCVMDYGWKEARQRREKLKLLVERTFITLKGREQNLACKLYSKPSQGHPTGCQIKLDKSGIRETAAPFFFPQLCSSTFEH